MVVKKIFISEINIVSTSKRVEIDFLEGRYTMKLDKILSKDLLKILKCGCMELIDEINNKKFLNMNNFDVQDFFNISVNDLPHYLVYYYFDTNNFKNLYTSEYLKSNIMKNLIHEYSSSNMAHKIVIYLEFIKKNFSNKKLDIYFCISAKECVFQETGLITIFPRDIKEHTLKSSRKFI